MGTHGFPPGAVRGNPWVPMGTYGNPWEPMGPHGSPWVPMGSHGSPWVPMGSHGFPWVSMGSHGFPWVPMGPHGSPWVPWSAMGCPWGPHGAPVASMENPRISEIVDFNENHYSVRQKIGDPGSKSIRNIIPVHPVTSKPPESPYGPLLDHFCQKSSFSVFSPIEPL